MKDYVILTDSSANLKKEFRDKYNIEYIPMRVTINGEDHIADPDWQEYSVKQFYDVMRSGNRILTAQVNEEAFRQRFEEIVKNGKDVIYISCSSGLSASIKSSYVARDKVKEIYPDSKIICIDSLRSGYCLGFICIEAAKLRNEGKSIEEVASFVEENKQKFHQAGTVQTLSYLRQAGRISGASAFFGGMLNVKPIIISNILGQNVSVEKVKGRAASFEKLVDYVQKEMLPEENNSITISHADCQEDAETVKEIILKRFEGVNLNLQIIDIDPIVGASTGPGTLILYYYGTEVTYQ